MYKQGVFCEKLEKVPKYIWILLAIVLVGVFLRTYHFHDWLEFKTDQARDAGLVSDVISGQSSWPSLGATMNGSADMPEKQFRIGPFYYYFQIISAKIFGNFPDKLAYPDLLFGIFSIPLLYFFLRRLLISNTALLLTGLYSISFFAVRFSRFAWNSNSIPFFVLLFLISLYELRNKKESVSWISAVTLGIAWGVGFQLHAISMVLFSLVCGYFFVVSTLAQPIIWKKWLVVFIVFFVLNLGQITSEIRTDFSNTKIFFQFFIGSDNGSVEKVSFLSEIIRTVDCHIEANFYMISSLGENSCSFYSTQIFTQNRTKNFLKNLRDPFFECGLLVGILFSLLGYAFLVSVYKKEARSDRRIFMNILIVYMIFSFFTMIPVVKGDTEFRYFNVVFFVPFIFLGLFIEYLDAHFSKFKNVFILSIVIAIVISNFLTLFDTGDRYSRKNAIGGANQVVLGEIEPIAEYMAIHSEGKKIVYIGANYELLAFMFGPLEYLMKRNGVSLSRVPDNSETSLSSEDPLFYLSYKSSFGGNHENKRIGQIYIYIVKK